MSDDAARTCADLGADLLRDGLGDVALELAAAGFAALWHGRAVLPEELLPDRGYLATEAALDLAARGRAELDEAGRLVGIHGLTLRETRHHFRVGGCAHRNWCAFDSVGIPAALGVDAVAVSTCPACERPIELQLRQGVPVDGPAVVWLPAVDGEDLMGSFCSSADLYCSREHLARCIDLTVAAGEVTDLATAAALGRAAWRDVGGVEVEAG